MQNSSAITPVFSVSEFAEAINRHLRLIGQITVQGEISQLRISQGKWLFMTIKDASCSVEVFGAVYELASVRQLAEGMQVHVVGFPRLYQKTGRFSLQAVRIVPSGEGALKLAYEKLKQQLTIEGLFAVERKRSLPWLPQKIGLITAVDSRAYSDFVKVLRERIGGLEVVLYPVQVQGNEAVASLLVALAYFANNPQLVDVLVITRGGGSLEDLASFNDERVARAVFASPVPTVSAIGHEADEALTDFVADLRASTPSNAAELLVPSRRELSLRIDSQTNYLFRFISEQLQTVRHEIAHAGQVFDRFYHLQYRSVQQLIVRMQQQVMQRQQEISLQQKLIPQLLSVAVRAMQVTLQRQLTHREQLERLLASFDPRQILKRGYTITKNEQGQIVRSASRVHEANTLTTDFIDGSVTAQVVTVQKGIHVE